jgi:predicted secreted protein
MAYNTTPFHGKVARIEKNNVAMAFSDGWQISTSLDMSDKSAQGDSWKSANPGLASWNGSFSGSFVAGNTEQKAFIDNIVNAAPGTKLTDVKFLLDASTNAYTGDIFITGISINAALSDNVKLTVNFQGDGALSLTDAA